MLAVTAALVALRLTAVRIVSRQAPRRRFAAIAREPCRASLAVVIVGQEITPVARATVVLLHAQRELNQSSVEAGASKSDDTGFVLHAVAKVTRTAMILLRAQRLLCECAVLAMTAVPVARFIAKEVASITRGAVVLLSTVLLRMKFAVCACAAPRATRPVEQVVTVMARTTVILLLAQTFVHKCSMRTAACERAIAEAAAVAETTGGVVAVEVVVV